MDDPLDRCIWHALSRRQAAFAHGNATALRYRTEYAPFAATADDSAASIAALHGIVPPHGAVALFTRRELAFPATLTAISRALVVQMVCAPGALTAPQGAWYTLVPHHTILRPPW